MAVIFAHVAYRTLAAMVTEMSCQALPTCICTWTVPWWGMCGVGWGHRQVREPQNDPRTHAYEKNDGPSACARFGAKTWE